MVSRSPSSCRPTPTRSTSCRPARTVRQCWDPLDLTVKAGGLDRVFAVGDPAKKTMNVAVHVIPTGSKGSGQAGQGQHRDGRPGSRVPRPCDGARSSIDGRVGRPRRVDRGARHRAVRRLRRQGLGQTPEPDSTASAARIGSAAPLDAGHLHPSARDPPGRVERRGSPGQHSRRPARGARERPPCRLVGRQRERRRSVRLDGHRRPRGLRDRRPRLLLPAAFDQEGRAGDSVRSGAHRLVYRIVVREIGRQAGRHWPPPAPPSTSRASTGWS